VASGYVSTHKFLDFLSVAEEPFFADAPYLSVLKLGVQLGFYLAATSA
jgi:hypothetical protein